MIAHIRTLIMNNPALYAEVGDRIYSMEFPTNDNLLPAIVMMETSGRRVATKDWESELRLTIWAINSSTEYGMDVADRISSRLINLLQGYHGSDSTSYIHSIDEPRKVPDSDKVDEFTLYKVHLTFTVIWKEK